jgi:hypothetical protein
MMGHFLLLVDLRPPPPLALILSLTSPPPHAINTQLWKYVREKLFFVSKMCFVLSVFHRIFFIF